MAESSSPISTAHEPMTREKVCQLHDLGYHCSQTVLWHTSQVLGVDRDLMLRLSSGMGGGAGAGSLCGAVNAAIATLGIAFGFSEPNAREQNARLAEKTSEFREWFCGRFGSLECRDLMGGLNFGIPEEAARIHSEGRGQRCRQLIADVCGKLDEML